MRDQTVARNYAEALFELARKNEALDRYQEGIETIARLLEENPRFRTFLETPRIPADDKKAVLRKAFGDALPRPLLNFLLVVIDKRRQKLVRAIAREYHDIVDQHMDRVHAEVTLARALDDQGMKELTQRLTALLGKTAIPHVRVKPDIIGGVVVRAGDTIYDGSLRRRLDGMRRQLLATQLTQ